MLSLLRSFLLAEKSIAALLRPLMGKQESRNE
jgi:hypothetical protein